MVKDKIRLSHSALSLLNTCERKFQLDRLLAGAREYSDYPPTVFGRAFGAGLQSYLIDQDIDKAIFTLWLSYNPVLEDNKRSTWICINALLCSLPIVDTFLLDWEVVIFDGKPSAELSFMLDIDEKFYHVGYIDIVMKNKYTGKMCIVEIKTTALTLYDVSPVYGNSDQPVGYSIVLDKIAGETQVNYDVTYIICQLGSGNGFEPSIQIKSFSKTLEDRFNWFLTLGMDRDRLNKMMELGYFPKRGDNCLKYNKVCGHYGTCHLTSLDRPAIIEPDVIEYQFQYKLDDIIQEHIERI